MGWYTINARATVDIAIDVEADSADAAKEAFDNNIALNAKLIDVPGHKQIVHDDSISECEIVSIDDLPEDNYD